MPKARFFHRAMKNGISVHISRPAWVSAAAADNEECSPFTKNAQNSFFSLCTARSIQPMASEVKKAFRRMRLGTHQVIQPVFTK